jgi:CHASE3 domain sensor protein
MAAIFEIFLRSKVMGQPNNDNNGSVNEEELKQAQQTWHNFALGARYVTIGVWVILVLMAIFLI